MIEFVSYTGRFPNLCSGVLTVRVDGREVRFGYRWDGEDGHAPLLRPFWRSGGCAGVNADFDEFCESGPWELDAPAAEAYPLEIWQRLPDLLACMNANVPHGCCGGCI